MSTHKLLEEMTQYGELLPNFKYKIVNIHPLADEIEVLERLDMEERDCVSCDFYWLYKNKIFFVQMVCLKQVKNDVKKYSTCYDKPHPNKFYIVLKSCPLTFKITEKVLDFLASWVEKNSEIIKEGNSKQLENFPEDL